VRLRDRFALAREVWQGFGRDNGFLLAAAVSFYAFLSLFPALLLAAGMLGYALGSPEHAAAVLMRFVGKLVVGPQAQAIIREVIHGRNAAAGIGLVVLLWSATSAIVALEQAVNLAWNTTSRRGFAKRRAVALLTLAVVGVLAALSFGAATLIHAAGAQHSVILAPITGMTRLLIYCVSALGSVALFTMIYKLLPYERVAWRAALVGGVFAGLMWEAAKHVFAFYVVRWPVYSRVYGSLASVMVLMLWIYYSAIIAILGAELASVWSGRRASAT
jgi:membrane protein